MRRTLLMLLACLVIGAITTVAIAWGFAIATKRAPQSRSAVSPSGLLAFTPAKREKVYFGDGEWHSVLQISTMCGDSVRIDYMAGDPVRDPHIAPHDLPRWTSAHRQPRETYQAITPDRSLHEEAWGWPLRALRSKTWLADDARGMRVAESSNGILVRNQYMGTYGFVSELDVRILPFMPLWLGLTLNSVVFGALWWALVIGIWRARSGFRALRGRCPRCGYDLRGDLARGCSECGWNRGPAAVEG